MRWALLAVLVLHGVIHFMGTAKAFGWSQLEALTQPVSRGMGLLWLIAGVTLLAAAVHLTVAPRWWWVTGLAGIVLSQIALASAWQDARFGTVANAVILVGVLQTLVSVGPWSFRAEFERGVAEAVASASVRPWPGDTPEPGDADVLTVDDLDRLPDPVRRYVQASGFVGAPKVAGFRALSRGRIRGSPDDPWMPFVAEQQNTLDPPSRLFHMKARRSGLPVDVLHVYRDGRATMRAKILSVVPVVDEGGPEMDQGETVTLFNDFALMAPGALAHPAIRWKSAEGDRARGVFTAGDEAVSATLLFDERGELKDFVSDDRFAAVGGAFEAWTWSTPVGPPQEMAAAGGRVRFVHEGEGRWHPDAGAPYTYLEIEVVELELLYEAR